MINFGEVLQTIEMIDQQHLDIRTITMGISIRDCAHPDPKICCQKIYDKITSYAGSLVKTGEEIEREFGIPIVNKRISVTPVAIACAVSYTHLDVYKRQVPLCVQILQRLWLSPYP